MSSFVGSLVKNLMYKNDIDISIKFFVGLIIIGCLTKLIVAALSNHDTPGGVGEATITLWSYSLVLFSILGIIILNTDNTKNTFNQIINFPWYLYVLSGLILWIISININYYSQINHNNIPPQYYTWNIWSTSFIIIITIAMLLEINSSNANSSPNNSLKKIINLLIAFVLFLVFIITGIQTTILQNFSVDG